VVGVCPRYTPYRGIGHAPRRTSATAAATAAHKITVARALGVSLADWVAGHYFQPVGHH
jgi:hypothetical protein